MPRKRTPLEPLARRLRATQTDAETRLWYHLRNRGLGDCKFRRQFPIGQYIADFVCVERHLIVELDGSQHLLTTDQDHRRSHLLVERGWRVLRFWNDAVIRETESVLEAILNALTDPSPEPSPLKRAREHKNKPSAWGSFSAFTQAEAGTRGT